MLAVLWLSAALAAIAFSLANTVRGETERTATLSDGTRAYYLAAGSIDRAILYISWQGLNPDGSPRYYAPWMPALRFSYPSWEVLAEIMPESAKLNINWARPADLHRLAMVLGADPERAAVIVQAILDWRSAQPPGRLSEFDQFYLSLTPSFRARHASFEEIEELLLVRGMTPELYYGGYERDTEGRLRQRPGLRDCLSVYGSGDAVNVNSAEPALMIALGVSAETAAAIADLRRRMPFRTMEQLALLGGAALPRMKRLTIGGSSFYTIRSTARLRLPDGRLSDLQRTVAATVKYFTKPGFDPPIQILRWYDNHPAPARSFQ